MDNRTTPFEAWPLALVSRYIDEHEGTLIWADKKIQIQFPDTPDRPAVLARIMPHLRARRAELIAEIQARFPGFFDSENCGQVRMRLIVAAINRGIAAGRKVFFLARDGHAVQANEPPFRRYYQNPKRKVIIPLSRSATHVCVEGEEWTELPRVTTTEEDVAMAPKPRLRGRFR